MRVGWRRPFLTRQTIHEYELKRGKYNRMDWISQRVRTFGLTDRRPMNAMAVSFNNSK